MYRFILLTVALAFVSCETKQITEFKTITVEYPSTRKDSSVIDDYFGTKIADPYRWLEDDHSEETKAWVTEQNEATFGYLDKIPFRSKIAKRLEKLWNYEKLGTPFYKGDRTFFYKNDGLQNQSVLYEDLGEDTKLILDPNSFSEDGTASLGGISFDKSGDLLAYLVSEGGSDWKTIMIMDAHTLQPLEDKVEWVKFSGISWYKDGFFYSRYAAPESNDVLSAKNEFHSLYYHKVGTPQSDDQLIYVDKEFAQRNVYAQTTEDESFLILAASESTSGNTVFIKDLTKENTELVQIVDKFDSDFSMIGNEDKTLYFLTNEGASNQELRAYDTVGKSWSTLISEQKDALRGASLIGGKLFLTYLHNASAKVMVHQLDGQVIQELALPGIGNIGGISGDKKRTDAYFSYTSYITPTTIYKLDTETLQYEVYKKPTVDFDGSQYETKQLWYKSYDGTEVPMFITHKKGLKLDGTNPTLLYGYGGFNISLLPGFSISRLPILENNGIYAVANIRGGGEFGKAWHKAGTLGDKQNVFNDFQAAAEYLIDNKYTSSEKLAIDGRSNGGLLVGACMTQRPDLYQVAFPGVGVLDMLRYHQFTIGWAWAADYGRSDDAVAFEYLNKYSPLHNVKEIEYPATMVVTADHDDRVVPAHSFKFISEVQAHQQGDNPTLIRIDVSAGHGAGKPTSMQIQESADMISFMFYNMKQDIVY